MSEEHKNQAGDNEHKEITYASPVKRIWAWVGVAYMLIITGLMTYLYAKGTYLHGIGLLMTIPALCGLAVTALSVWRTGSTASRTPGRLAFLMGIVILCAVLIVINLTLGIPALLQNFGG